ncbi:methyl-accepting chemotaxis protein [Aneurinibacillus terranovensis]|uniref:methyl-accepting chemotaxis protein n=1 Tax=Aneurinibacillus terranovensis TaxID=278991 RepID=UPI0004079A40|nr:methyl-accepting chemotaxis protein [Aneurinibacillus terranovensis]
MKIQTKVGIVVTLLVLYLLSIGIYSLSNNQQLQQVNQQITSITNNQNDFNQIQYRLAGVSNDERGYLLTGDQTFIKELESKKAEIRSLLAQIKKNDRLDASGHSLLDSIQSNFETYDQLNEQVVATFQSGNKAKAQSILFGEERTIRKEKVDPSVTQFSKLVTGQVNALKDELKQKATKQEFLFSFLVISMIVLVMASWIFIVLSIVRPLKKVSGQLVEIADGEGDLTRELTVSSKDEVGELANSFNRMIHSLRNILMEINETSAQLAASSEELTASAEQTSKATEQIAMNIQEMAAGTDKTAHHLDDTDQIIHYLSEYADHISQNAENVSESAVQASEVVAQGNEAIKNATDQMNEIFETVQQVVNMAKTLGDRSAEIGKIVAFIQEIASQTNLLSLNAAIEAARAGEHGRGFAVVADEVRKLAEQTSKASEQITKVIQTIQMETEKVIKSVDESTIKVADGAYAVSIAGESFGKIQQAVAGVTGQIQEVSAAIEQITTKTAEVATSVDNITTVVEAATDASQNVSAASQEQLASMEEIASSASQLSMMAEKLQDVFRRFKL